MTAASDPFGAWLEQAGIRTQRLTPEQRGLLQAAFAFRHDQGDDYYTLDEGEPACTTRHGEGSGKMKHHPIG